MQKKIDLLFGLIYSDGCFGLFKVCFRCVKYVLEVLYCLFELNKKNGLFKL